MKKKLLLMLSAFSSISFLTAQITNPAPYCATKIASLTIQADNHIKNVTIGTLSNNTGSVYLNGSEYAYYNNIAPVNLQKGIAIPATFTVSRNDAEMDALWIYIDYNMNNMFDPNELVGQAAAAQFTVPSSFGLNVTIGFNITIPTAAQNGQTRMRIIYTSADYLTPAMTPTACNTDVDLFSGHPFAYGEIEDYDVTIGSGQTNAAPAAASFTTSSSQCLTIPFTPMNTSAGFPIPTYVWSSSPPVSFSPNNTASSPSITINTPGSYTITLVATNSLASSTATFIVSAQSTCNPQTFCFDSLKIIKSTDSLKSYHAPNSAISGCGSGASRGFLAGTNCYKDKEVAQFFPPGSYSSISNPQVNGVIVLFDAAGTKTANALTPVVCKIYGGSAGGGPAAIQGSKSESLDQIVQTPTVSSVGYIGKPGVPITNTAIYPYRFNFTNPVIISSPSTGFFAGIELPNTLTDSVSIVSSTKINSSLDSSAWYMSANLSWSTFKTSRNSKIQLAIIPVITCFKVGIKEEAADQFSSNITIMPNPSSGLFNFAFTLSSEQSLTINIYNAIGQQLVSSNLMNIKNNMIHVDLSGKPDGLYYAEISNGSEKVVKKIIVSH